MRFGLWPFNSSININIWINVKSARMRLAHVADQKNLLLKRHNLNSLKNKNPAFTRAEWQ